MDILVVDDDELTREVLVLLLREYGYRAHTAGDGLEAISFLRNRPTPLVITDWMMPNVDGLELIREIRSRPAAHYTYIIMMTIKNSKTDLVKAIEAGADSFLGKPVDANELGAALKSAKRLIDLDAMLTAKNAELERAYDTIKKDVIAAGRIPKSLLPTKPPENNHISFHWMFRPYSELGGDIFNVFHIDRSLLGLYIIDVSGNGVEAALLAVTLSRMLTPMADYILPIDRLGDVPHSGRILGPAEIANLLNARFYHDEANYQFFTMLYGVIDTDRMEFTYTTAGHNGTIYSRKQSDVSHVSEQSYPICATDNPDYQEKSLSLSAGDRLFFFTDGLYESADDQDVHFGIDRMLTIIENGKSDPLSIVEQNLYAEAKSWCAPDCISDDVTILSLEVLKGR